MARDITIPLTDSELDDLIADWPRTYAPDIAAALYEVRRLRDQVDRMRPVVEAARAMVADWDDTSGSMSRIDAMNEHCATIAARVDVLDTGKTNRVIGVR